VSEQSLSIAAFAFAFLAVDSTYAIFQSDAVLRKTSPWLARFGLPDLPPTAAGLESAEIQVVDFNPQVIDQLRRRGVHVIYGDISQRDVLLHAGVANAEVLICSLPDMILKGASNRKLLRQLRDLNPTAKIIVHAEKLADIPTLYAAGASYVTAPRLLEAADLVNVIEAADKHMLDQKRKEQAELLEERNEVLA
jgi:voltage-gated potassium channel Kch